jgi:lysozyme
MTPAQKAAAVLSAAALAVPLIATHEGWVKVGYRDPVGIPTACYGHTGGVVLGRTYSADECVNYLAQDAVQHGLDIDRCLTREIPPDSRTAFTSFAFNVGAAKFCGSTVAKKANAGDLKGACAELSRWTYAGGKVLPGLVKRRADERARCERGLS